MNWLVPTAHPVPVAPKNPAGKFPITVKERSSVSGKTDAPRRTPKQTKVKLVAVCPTCTNKFIQATTWQKFCSPRCRDNRETGKMVPVTAGNLVFLEPAWRTKNASR